MVEFGLHGHSHLAVESRMLDYVVVRLGKMEEYCLLLHLRTISLWTVMFVVIHLHEELGAGLFRPAAESW